MKIKKLGIVILALLLGFFVFQKTLADNNEDIVISEIMYDALGSDSKKEWIEVFNNTNDEIDLSEWVLIESSREDISHEIKKEGEKNLTPGDYAIIAENAEYFLNEHDDFSGAIFDSSFSLDNSKEEITLKNIENDIKISVDYSNEYGANGNGHSLELEGGEWRQSYILGGTPGRENSEKPEVIEYKRTIRINEIFPNPKEEPANEYKFVELYNYGDEKIDLEKWKIKDRRNNKIELSVDIEPGEYLALFGVSFLNKDEDSIEIIDPSNKSVDKIDYEKSQEGLSYGFNEKDKKWNWGMATPSEKNKFEEKKKYSRKVKINEIFPNPEEDEGENEFIELYNYSDKELDLENWALKDSSKSGKYIFPKDKKIKAGGYIGVYRDDFSFALNNSGKEEVYLLDPNNEEVDDIEYVNPKENVSYGFDDFSKKWRWSKFLTPGERNEFSEVPDIKVDIDKEVYINMYASFKVKVRNIKGEDLDVKWDFGDGKKSYEAETRHKYYEKGRKTVLVTVFDGSESFEFKNTVNVKEFPEYELEIVSFLPNPRGMDMENEWIEIENKSGDKLNLMGWSIANGGDKENLINHPIIENFFIKKNEVKKITREHSSFSLNNESGYVELRYPNRKAAFGVGYKKEGGAEEDEVYGRNKNGEWKWIVFQNFSNESVDDMKNVKQEDVIESIQDDEGVSMVLGEGDEYVGKMSQKLFSRNKFLFDIYSLKKEIIDIIWRNRAAVREEGGVYYFNPRAKAEKHYFIKFLERFI